MKTALTSISLTALAIAATTTHAYAYIDPVTGSFLIQGIAAGIAGVMVAFRSVRQKVFAFLSVRKSGSGSRTRHDS
jgi:hypothetical protein